MYYFQIAIVVLLTLRFLVLVLYDFEGRPARPATGFQGFIGTAIMTILVGWIYYSAGAFNLIFK